MHAKLSPLSLPPSEPHAGWQRCLTWQGKAPKAGLDAGKEGEQPLLRMEGELCCLPAASLSECSQKQSVNAIIIVQVYIER